MQYCLFIRLSYLSAKTGHESSRVCVRSLDWEKTTVKFGYNDHGFNEFTAVTNKICRILWSQIVTLLHKPSQLYRCYGYNKQY
jgi:hypothetical protein